MTARVTPAAASEAVDLTDDVRFREQTGLRSDERWIHSVRSGSEPNYEFGVALTQAEAVELQGRALLADALAQKVRAYAGDQPEFAGLRIRADQGGVVELRLSGRIEEHRAALAKLVHPEAMLRIIKVTYTWAELNDLAKHVAAENEWMAAVHGALVASGVDDVSNKVRIEVSSANPEIARLIVDHYDAEGRMYVVSDGTGVKLLPFGEVLLTVVDHEGRPLPGLSVRWESDIPGAGTDAVGYFTEADGTTLLTLRALGQTIRVYEGGSRRELGSGHMVVRAGVRTTLQIEVGE